MLDSHEMRAAFITVNDRHPFSLVTGLRRKSMEFEDAVEGAWEADSSVGISTQNLAVNLPSTGRAAATSWTSLSRISFIFRQYEPWRLILTCKNNRVK